MISLPAVALELASVPRPSGGRPGRRRTIDDLLRDARRRLDRAEPAEAPVFHPRNVHEWDGRSKAGDLGDRLAIGARPARPTATARRRSTTAVWSMSPLKRVEAAPLVGRRLGVLRGVVGG